MNFNELTENQTILRAVNALGFKEPSQIQTESIPNIQSGMDVLAQSQTGTGKTVAYAIPTIENIILSDKRVQVLIVCPTRELAVQVTDEYRKLLRFSENISAVTLYGGENIGNQIRRLKKNPKIVVGTPGRLRDHLRRKTLKLDGVRCFILDEADEMLKMGFSEEIHEIYSKIPCKTQNLMFSATIPKSIEKLSKEYLFEPSIIKIEPKQVSSETVKQSYVAVKKNLKKEVIVRILEEKAPEKSIVFCNTRKMVDELTGYLTENGYSADRIHGDLRQEQRIRVMRRFNNGEFKILVATDVAGRGIDIKNVDLVINYDMPDEEDSYVHRIGRSGRAGKDGEAISIVTSRDREMLESIQKYIKKDIEYKKIPRSEEAELKNAEEYLLGFVKQTNDSEKEYYRTVFKALQRQGFTLEDIAVSLLKEHKNSVNTEDLNDYNFFNEKNHNRERKNRSGRRNRKR